MFFSPSTTLKHHSSLSSFMVMIIKSLFNLFSLIKIVRSQRIAHQLVSQSQIISPGNMLTSNIVQIEQIIVRNIYVYLYPYMYAITIN